VGAVAALVLIIAACSAPEATAPTSQAPPIGFPGGAQGGGGSGTTAAALAGHWQRFDVLTADSSSDVITQTTEWVFDTAGFCQRIITTESATEGIPRQEQRGCSYVVGAQSITITWDDSTVNEFSFSFAGFDPDRLVLDGLEYDRVDDEGS
jgi:hypothetical protein